MPTTATSLALIPALVLGAGVLAAFAPETEQAKPGEPEPFVLTISWDDAPDEKAPVKVDAALYAAADWPAHNPDLYAENFQGKKLEVPLGQETWLTPEQDLAGKVLVLDFWATWCAPCIAATPRLAELQKAYDKGLAVVGVSGQNEDIGTVRAYLDEKEPSFAYVHDDKQGVFAPFKSRGIPLAVVVSTDGVVRWMGNPLAKEFKEAVEQVVRVDPLVKARSKG